MRKIIFGAALLLSCTGLHAAEFKDYYEFVKYWDAHPAEWVTLYKANKDFGFRWMVDEPHHITFAYFTNPAAFCDIIEFNTYVIAMWRDRDKEAYKEWTGSNNCHACMRAHPELLQFVDYNFTTDVLSHFPDLFVPFATNAKTNPAYIQGWAAYKDANATFNQVYLKDPAAKEYIDKNPALKAQIKPQPA